jgi:insulysin
MSHASNLLQEPISTYPQKNLLPDHYDPQTVQEILDYLTPENAYYFLIADPKETHVYPNKKEKWNGGEYITLPIDEALLSTWKNLQTAPHLALPPPNPFIPTTSETTSLLKTSSEVSTQQDLPLLPLLIEDSPGAKCFFVEDSTILLPKLSLLFRIKTPSLDCSPKSYAYGLIYIRHVEKTLKSLFSTAEAAGISSDLNLSTLSLTITVDGYAEKAPVFFETLLKSIKTLPPLPQEDFNLYVSSLIINLENVEKELPVAQGKTLLYTLLQKPSVFYKDLRKSLDLVSLEEYQNFQNHLFDKNYVEGTLTGTLSKTQAEDFVKQLKSALGTAPYSLKEQIQESAFSLQNKGPFHVHEKTSLEGCGLLLAIDQGPFSFESYAVQQILAHSLVEPFFTTLRSKQAIAYIAKTWSENIENQLFQIFAVQSSSQDAKDLTYRFEFFLEDFLREITTQVPFDRFNELRNDIIKTQKIPPKNYPELTSEVDFLAFDKDQDFSWKEKYIGALETLSYENFLQLTKKFLSKTNKAKLTVSVEGKLTSDQKISSIETPLEEVKMLRFK